MGAKGARCSMNTKGALRKILSTLHPILTLHLTLIKTEYWDRAGGGGNISYECCGTPMSHTLKAVDGVESACK